MSEAEPGSTPSAPTHRPSVLPPAHGDVSSASSRKRASRGAGNPSRPQLQIAPNAGTATFPPDAATPALATAVPNLPPPTSTEIAQVEQRLKDNLTSEMFNNFELFLYVSKASTGPVSQRMFVFQKEPSGDLALAYNWPVLHRT